MAKDRWERARRQIDRPSTVATLQKPIVEILHEQPDLASLEILRRVREAGYQGGKSALYSLVASLRHYHRPLSGTFLNLPHFRPSTN